ncbi:Amino Acid/Auxin Permease (AAAP) Family [Thraustotheca clavata]|uniref:Amino Acid/Auxin Permease (AAAP) Family n=1 Tax=Thraustotheca clavata TaxID=74557 RepID=A0A1V9Y820_9STRA|nr:Amino Acid/Auxin Permease (AAAP) Family [Thraustotheca clavata]
MVKLPLTLEDFKACFSIWCFMIGVGTLGMPGSYARAGFVWTTIAMVFMAYGNAYGAICLSKVMLVAPKSVKTYGDIGGWVFGPVGRYVSVLFQMLVCLLIPIAFLILGGSLLVVLFPNSFADTTWIILMGLMLLPVTLIPTLKEGATVAAVGALGTVLADSISVYLIVTNMNAQSGDLSPPKPVVTFSSIVSVFGNLNMAFGCGLVIPSIQLEHSNPVRMQRVITVALLFITVFFVSIAVAGDWTVGCQIPGNLLFAIDDTKLGFTANRGYVVLAFLFMQLHVTIAFAIVAYPALFNAERLFLGLHKDAAPVLPSPAVDDEGKPVDFVAVGTPNLEHVSNTAALVSKVEEGEDRVTADYKAPGAYLKASLLRTLIVIIMIVVAIVWKDSFNDLVDFVGASSGAMTCMVLPMVFHLKVNHATMGLPEKIVASIYVVITTILAVYVTYTTGKTLFAPGDADPTILFSYCPEKYQRVVYTNRTYYNL